ncbi:Os1348 family NHLP clan protein [Chloroflexota bacterium]
MATKVTSEKIGLADIRERPPKEKPKAMPKGKEAILEVLSRAADDSGFLARLVDDPSEALAEYYTLTSQEKAALASGDIKRIESWVGKLDKRLATWLWCRLSQEKW